MTEAMLEGILVPFLETSPAVPVSAISLSEGVPRQRFRKEIIRTGEYTKDSDGLRFKITPSTLQHWAAEFARMKANGVKVAIPANHDDAGKSERNMGFVDDLFVDGNSLVMLAELVGKEALELAARNDVSLFATPKFTDGKGQNYTYPIMHVAMTPEPVIPGLNSWVPIAASRNRSLLMDLKKIGEALGITTELKPETAEALILSRTAEIGAATKALQDDVTKLKAEAARLKDALAAAEKAVGSPPEKPTPLMLSLATEHRSGKLDSLVDKGKITPAVRKELAEIFIGSDGAALELSQSGLDQFSKLVRALENNNPVELRASRTGVQLPDPTGKGGAISDEKNPLLVDAENRAKAAKAGAR